MSARVFVTGASGFVGQHLAEVAARDSAAFELVAMADVDLRDRAAIERVVAAAQPRYVVHLAAQSAVPQSFVDPHETYAVNFTGTLSLLEALASAGFRGRMLFAGSGDEYGRVDDAALPVRETQPLRPRNPYAVSKVAAETLCYQWSQTGPFEIVLARSFNSIGPRQSTRFAIADFARRIAEIALGRGQPRLVAGDVDVSRDFTDVRDVVSAYLSLLAGGVNGEAYNVCSGRERVLRDVIAQMAGIAGVALDIATDPARLRAGEQRRMVGSPEKLHAATGWSASIPFETTLRDILNDWTRRLT